MELSDSVRNNLNNGINDIIIRCGNNVISNQTVKPTEPVLTKELAKQITFGLYEVLSINIPDFYFSIHSIFCHQCPRIKFANKEGCCELGDLLFVFDEVGKKTGNALLLQAKKLMNGKFRAKNNEVTQLTLYREWPEFTYQNHAMPNESRKIEICDSFSGAQYLLIYKPYDNSDSYRCSLPNKVEGIEKENTALFTQSFINLLSGKIGGKYDISLSSTASDDWSKMVHDLLNIGAVIKCSHLIVKDRTFHVEYPVFNNDFAAKYVSSSEDKEKIGFIKNDPEIFHFVPLDLAMHSIDKGRGIDVEISEHEKPFLLIHITVSEKEYEKKTQINLQDTW